MTCVLSLGLASPAFAYVGPGAGLSLLGALWGLLAAVAAALAFVLFWPIKRMIRGRREKVTSDKASASDVTAQNTIAGDSNSGRATQSKHPAQQA